MRKGGIEFDCQVDHFSKWAYSKLADAGSKCVHNKAQRCLPMYSAGECRKCYVVSLGKEVDE